MLAFRQLRRIPALTRQLPVRAFSTAAPTEKVIAASQNIPPAPPSSGPTSFTLCDHALSNCVCSLHVAVQVELDAETISKLKEFQGELEQVYAVCVL